MEFPREARIRLAVTEDDVLFFLTADDLHREQERMRRQFSCYPGTGADGSPRGLFEEAMWCLGYLPFRIISEGEEFGVEFYRFSDRASRAMFSLVILPDSPHEHGITGIHALPERKIPRIAGDFPFQVSAGFFEAVFEGFVRVRVRAGYSGPHREIPDPPRLWMLERRNDDLL